MKSIALFLCFLLIIIKGNCQLNQKESTTMVENLTVKKLNKQIQIAKSGFMFGGLTMAAGSVINIIALKKKEPKTNAYADSIKYQLALNYYNQKQKDMKFYSNILYGFGGITMLITGLTLSPIYLKNKQNASIKVESGINHLALTYTF